MSKKAVHLREIGFDDELPEFISYDSGRQIEDAIVIKLSKSPAENPMAIHFKVLQKEQQIIRHMVCKCGKAGHAQVIAQMNIQRRGRSYDLLSLQCPETKETWVVYFDVTDLKKFISPANH